MISVLFLYIITTFLSWIHRDKKLRTSTWLNHCVFRGTKYINLFDTILILPILYKYCGIFEIPNLSNLNEHTAKLTFEKKYRKICLFFFTLYLLIVWRSRTICLVMPATSMVSRVECQCIQKFAGRRGHIIRVREHYTIWEHKHVYYLSTKW